MSELRLNLVTREWVVIATERAKRPTDYANGVPLKAPLPEHLSSCPFCAGNENRTPQERHRLPDDGSGSGAGVEHVIIFKTHGEGAGTSLEHTHSQLVATPVVPVQWRERVYAAQQFFDNAGECLMCAILRQEKEEGARVIIDTEHFLTFIPYPALSPFHTWIFPTRHSAPFSTITAEEIKDLAYQLKAF